MKSYMLLIKGSFAQWNKFSQEEKDHFVKLFGEYAGFLRDKGYLKGGDGCAERSFRITQNTLSLEEALISPDTTDMVTGYFFIEVPDEETAFSLAKQSSSFKCGEYVELVPCAH